MSFGSIIDGAGIKHTILSQMRIDGIFLVHHIGEEHKLVKCEMVGFEVLQGGSSPFGRPSERFA